MAPRCVIARLYKCHDHRHGKSLTSHRGAKVFLIKFQYLFLICVKFGIKACSQFWLVFVSCHENRPREARA